MISFVLFPPASVPSLNNWPIIHNSVWLKLLPTTCFFVIISWPYIRLNFDLKKWERLRGVSKRESSGGDDNFF